MKYQILIVDDEEITRTLINDALGREGYRMLTAFSAEEGLGVLESENVDVVISDEKMPGMSGSAFLSIVREKYPDTIRIMLTGHADLNTAIRAINEGEIYRFFTKPCNLVDLAVTIRQGLLQKELVEENKRLELIVARQATDLDALEKQSPGITQVQRDADGNVIINLDDE